MNENQRTVNTRSAATVASPFSLLFLPRTPITDTIYDSPSPGYVAPGVIGPTRSDYMITVHPCSTRAMASIRANRPLTPALALINDAESKENEDPTSSVQKRPARSCQHSQSGPERTVRPSLGYHPRWVHPPLPPLESRKSRCRHHENYRPSQRLIWASFLLVLDLERQAHDERLPQGHGHRGHPGSSQVRSTLVECKYLCGQEDRLGSRCTLQSQSDRMQLGAERTRLAISMYTMWSG